MFVLISPKTKRAKDRCKQHGNIMLFKKEVGGRILVESLDNTWKGERWMGWFSNDEASWERYESVLL